MKYICIAVGRNIIFCIFVLELFFRFVIPASNVPMSYFYEKDKMYAYSNKQKDGVNTIGKTAGIKAKWHINKQGWNYPIDYQKTDKKLIAVIGSSHVTALQVDCDKKFPYLLRKKLGKMYEVYGFGHDGAPASQHLWISRYLDKHFNPDIFIYDITNGSLEWSAFILNDVSQCYLTLTVGEDGKIAEITPKINCAFRQYRKSKGFWRKSAFLRYLYFNLKLDAYFQNCLENRSKAQSLCKTKSQEIPLEELIEFLFGKIREENPDKRIIFILIPPPEIIYVPDIKNEKFALFRKTINKISGKHNIEIIDLTLPMHEDYKLHKKKFTFDIDLHWNEYGHEFVASLLYQYLQK
ncbi:MAG: SGNH/GDSL hydrolase family protein [Candidatus Omnitrophota bacterium]